MSGYRCRRSGRGWRGSRCRTALGRFGCRFFRGAFRFRSGLRVRDALQMALHLFRNIGGDRAGVRLLFGDAKACQKVNDGLGLDLELAR